MKLYVTVAVLAIIAGASSWYFDGPKIAATVFIVAWLFPSIFLFVLGWWHNRPGING